MYTLGYSFRPWKDAKAIADGPSILSYIREVASDHGIDARIRYGHRVVAANWSTPEARWTVEIEQGPEGAQDHDHLRLPVDVQRLLRLRGGLYARVPGDRALQGPHRPSAEMDRGHRLQGQEGRGDRQRRHGGHPGAGDGARGGARHHAAALADLRRGAAGRGFHRQSPAPPPADQARLRPDALEERPARHVLLPALQAPAGSRQGVDPEGRALLPGPRLRHREAFHATLQPVGPAAVPGARRRPVPRHPRQAGVGRHRPDRDLHRDRHSPEVRQRARGRPGRDRDRAGAAAPGRHDRGSRRQGRSTRPTRLPTRA